MSFLLYKGEGSLGTDWFLRFVYIFDNFYGRVFKIESSCGGLDLESLECCVYSVAGD